MIEPVQPVFHQHHIRLFKGRIGSAHAHGDAHIGGGQAGRIVDAVPDHGGFFARFRPVFDACHFLVRGKAEFKLAQAHLPSHRPAPPPCGRRSAW
jgi:hypothetical protein